MRALMQESRVKLFSRELPPEERLAAQNIVALGAADKDVLSERPKGNGLRPEEAAQVEPVESGLKLLIGDQPKVL